jgi:putative FmdB family regulatory protein
MPTYEYECDACGEKFEKFQPITSVPIRKCPSCGKRKVRRLIGAGAGIIFKGSGFYQTDYRSDSYKKAAEKDKPAAAATTESKGASGAGESKAGSSGGEAKTTPAKSDGGGKKKAD